MARFDFVGSLGAVQRRSSAAAIEWAAGRRREALPGVVNADALDRQEAEAGAVMAELAHADRDADCHVTAGTTQSRRRRARLWLDAFRALIPSDQRTGLDAYRGGADGVRSALAALDEEYADLGDELPEALGRLRRWLLLTLSLLTNETELERLYAGTLLAAIEPSALFAPFQAVDVGPPLLQSLLRAQVAGDIAPPRSHRARSLGRVVRVPV
jgi:hypothetical protein